MENIASVIYIKNITRSETRNHASGHEKIKSDARKEILTKSPAYANARNRYAIFYLHCRMNIHPSKLYKITEAWLAMNVDSKIMWIKADRETVQMLREVKRKSKTPIDVEFMEFTQKNHMIIRK